jgi:hypothetical protein
MQGNFRRRTGRRRSKRHRRDSERCGIRAPHRHALRSVSAAAPSHRLSPCRRCDREVRRRSEGHPRIQRVPQCIADEADGQHRDQDHCPALGGGPGPDSRRQEQSDAGAWQSDPPGTLESCGVSRQESSVTNRLLYQLSYVGPGPAGYHIRHGISSPSRRRAAGNAWCQPQGFIGAEVFQDARVVPGNVMRVSLRPEPLWTPAGTGMTPSPIARSGPRRTHQPGTVLARWIRPSSARLAHRVPPPARPPRKPPSDFIRSGCSFPVA